MKEWVTAVFVGLVGIILGEVSYDIFCTIARSLISSVFEYPKTSGLVNAMRGRAFDKMYNYPLQGRASSVSIMKAGGNHGVL